MFFSIRGPLPWHREQRSVGLHSSPLCPGSTIALTSKVMMCTPKRDPEARGAGVNEPARSFIDAESLRGLETWRPPAFLRVGPGRETFAWRSPDGLEAIVKRFRGRGGLEAWRERLGGRAPRSPGRREFEALVELRAAGLPVPQPMAHHESVREPGLSLVVMERLQHTENLRQLLTRESQAASLYFDALLAITTGLHGSGWYHRDLYLDHFLVLSDDSAAGARAPSSVALIDVGRARRDASPRERWFIKDLAALWHSTPTEVPRRLALRFLAKWLNSRGIDGRAARRRTWRAILAKERRMAAHVPRGGTSHPATPDSNPNRVGDSS